MIMGQACCRAGLRLGGSTRESAPLLQNLKYQCVEVASVLPFNFPRKESFSIRLPWGSGGQTCSPSQSQAFGVIRLST